MSTEEDREALEQGIRAAVTDAMSRLTREEIHELVMEYATVVEKVRDLATIGTQYVDDPVDGERIIMLDPKLVLDALSTAPADALREHDAALIESLADEVGQLYFGGGSTGSATRWGAKQAAARLRERARQVREGSK